MTEGEHPKNQLDNVVFQMRFPAMLSIDRDMALFQDRIKACYPVYDAFSNMLPNVANIPSTRDYAFYSEDRSWSASLSVATLSLVTSRYAGWSDFFGKAMKLIDDASSCFSIDEVTRIGLRYVNAIKPSSMGFPAGDFKSLIDSRYLHGDLHPEGWRIDDFNASRITRTMKGADVAWLTGPYSLQTESADS